MPAAYGGAGIDLRAGEDKGQHPKVGTLVHVPLRGLVE